MAEKLPATRTPIRVPELAEALHAAGVEVGFDLSRAALLVLLAQWHLETGGGEATIQWNLGNAKSVAGDGYDWTEFPTTEVVKGAVIHVTARFRAFTTLAAGAVDYLRLLSKRFASAWPAVLTGDAEGFARELHVRGYYTAPVDMYVRGMRARLGVVARAWPVQTAPLFDEPIVAAENQPVFISPDPALLERELVDRDGQPS